MPEFSNLLRQRLAVGERTRVRPGNHPDADTLTAYAEQLLPARERNQVLEHLSACDDCREVVALSLPEPEAAIAVAGAASAAGRRRFAWKWTPAFGLAASVAVLAIVTVAVIERPHPAGPSFANRDNQPASVAPATSAPSAPASTPSAEGNASASAQPENAKTVSPGVISNAHTSGAPAMAAAPPSRELARAADSAGRPMAAPPPATPVVSASASTILAYSTDRQDYKNQMFDAEARSVEPGAVAVNDLPAAPAPQQSNQNLFAINNSITMPVAGLNQNAPSPHLRITTPSSGGKTSGPHLYAKVGGELKDLILPKRYSPPITAGRGFLGNNAMGGTQLNPAKESDQSVAIAAAPASDKAAGDLDQLSAFTARAMGATASEKKELAPGWKVADGRLLKSSDSAAWAEAYSGAEGIAFSVVNARGPEVWAGGANAALVHSRDGGATWERITLGASATGTITSIETGRASVRVKSSSGQSWSSADGGKSWTLQD